MMSHNYADAIEAVVRLANGTGGSLQRGAVHVKWSEDQLEISSPGGFPSGIRLDNLLVAPPHPRSPLLADAFKRTGLVERTGRGVNRIFAEQLRVGRPAPDYGRSSDAHVVAVLPGGPVVTRVVNARKGRVSPQDASPHGP